MANCSKEGNKYENRVYQVVKHCITIPYDDFFNYQDSKDIGSSSNRSDIVCDWNGLLVPIEIKKKGAPDWSQCTLNLVNGKLKPTFKKKEQEHVIKVFERILQDKVIFNGKIPPFLQKKITHEEWIKIKKQSNDFTDQYIDCDDDTIINLYSSKGCEYIQISDKGLYYLEKDVCGFNVPQFRCEQRLRIRTKIHKRKDTKGFCQLSVTVACQPKNIKLIENSPFSLDNVMKIPKNLRYCRTLI